MNDLDSLRVEMVLIENVLFDELGDRHYRVCKFAACAKYLLSPDDSLSPEELRVMQMLQVMDGEDSGNVALDDF
jgi:hypothetical protein